MALDTIPKQEGGKLKAVASGTLPSGQPVVVNADGTVSVVASTSVSSAIGSETVFTTNYARYIGSAYDATSNRAVIVYRDDSDGDKTKVVLGQISGTAVTFGTPALVTNDIMINPPPVVFDSANDKIVVFHTHSTSPYSIKAYVGTVSGSSISFGTAVTAYAGYSSGGGNSMAAATFDSSNSKIVLVWRDESNSNYGTAKVGTVSGTSISFGSAVIFHSTYVYNPEITYDSGNSKVVVAYRDVNGGDGKAVVGTVSGTSISFGSPAQYESGEPNEIDIGYESSSGTVVVGYKDDGNSNYGTAAVGTVSGTSISFGTPVVFNNSGNTNYIKVVGSPDAGKVLVVYKDSDNDGSYQIGTVSGTSISFTAEADFEPNNPNDLSPVYDTTNKVFLISYHDQPNSNYGTGIVLQIAYTSTNLTAENYIGMSGGVVDVDSQTEDIGSAVVFNNTGNTTKPHLCFDTNSNKVVIGFVDNAVSEKGTAIVGTVSGTGISFGSETVYETSVTDFPAMVFDSSNNKVIVAYQDEGNSDYGTAAVGTVSGTSISFGTPVVFESAAVQHVSLAFDSNSNKVVVSYSDHGNSEHGTAIVGTVSGTSISFGSAAVFQSAQTARVNSTFDSSNNKVIIAYRTSTGQAVVGTVSGTSISFGTPVQFKDELTDELDIVFDSNANKVVIAYLNGAGSLGLAKVGTVSGTSISFGAEATFESDTVYSISPVFDSSINKVVIVYQDADNSNYGTSAVGTISGTDITFETPTVFASVNVYSSVGATFDSSNNKVVIAYRDGSNSNYGTSVVMIPGYTDITRGQVASGGNATVDIVGTVSTNQVGLTAGQQYFVQTDGTLGLTAASPSVLAGTAISATKLVVKT